MSAWTAPPSGAGRPDRKKADASPAGDDATPPRSPREATRGLDQPPRPPGQVGTPADVEPRRDEEPHNAPQPTANPLSRPAAVARRPSRPTTASRQPETSRQAVRPNTEAPSGTATSQPPTFAPVPRPQIDERGLTALLATLLAFALSACGLAIDAATGKALGAIFDVCFVLGCVVALCLVQRRYLRMALTMPPLLYCLLALIGGAVDSSQNALSLRSQALSVLSALVLGAPWLFLATGLAVAVAIARAFAAGRRTR